MKGLHTVDKKMRILIVDDFSSMRSLIKKALAVLGFENVSEASGAVDAVRKLEAGESFDFIISDWNMPNMTGLELLTYVRSADKTRTVPFLMITAEAKRENIVSAAKAGVSQYIVKPFTSESLQEKIETIFSRSNP